MANQHQGHENHLRFLVFKYTFRNYAIILYDLPFIYFNLTHIPHCHNGNSTWTTESGEFFFFCNIVCVPSLKTTPQWVYYIKTISLSSCLRELNLLFGHTCRGHMRLLPPLFPGNCRARACAHTRRAGNKRRQSARQDNVLERLGAGGASVLQHAAAIFPPIRAAQIKSLDFAHTHQHFKERKKKKIWQMVHKFTPETPHLTLIGYDYIWEYMSKISLIEVCLILYDLFLN